MGRSRVERLEAIYGKIPGVACKGLCGWDDAKQDGCCGPLRMTRLERQRIVQAAGFGPKSHPQTMKCNMLGEDGSCRVYDVRPLICRLWGAVRAMSCPHGCKPDRYLTVAESVEIVRQVREIGGPEITDRLDPEARAIRAMGTETSR